MKSTLGVKITS